MNIVLSFYNTSRQMVRHNNSISFWTVNNNCNVPPVKRCVVFYSDFACLSIHARHDISIWNIASIEMMDEKHYIKTRLVSWPSLESSLRIFYTIYIVVVYGKQHAISLFLLEHSVILKRNFHIFKISWV